VQATRPAKDPRKQRKLLHDAPAHLRHKLMAASLSPQLITSKGAKTLPVRKGDSVRIMRGDHKGFEGKISRVDLKNYRIYVEGLTREKVDGTTIFIPLHPSKVMIRNLNLDDKWRKAIAETKKKLLKEEEKAVTKPPKAVEVKEEKPVEKKVVAQEKLAEKKPKARKRVRKKPAAKKKKEEKPAEEEKPAKKEEKPKTAKRTRAKRKTASEKGGT
jgi:large subunit ribosomal protein L24